jgi:hypothetical protein
MKLKKQIVRKKSESPHNSDTLDDFHDDEICSHGRVRERERLSLLPMKFPQSVLYILTSTNFTDEKGLPIQRNTANARERARMRVLSSAFYRLKTIIPWVPADTKLSKLDTLRLARNYIAYLSATLEGQPVNEITNKMPHPQKMVRFPLFPSLKFFYRVNEREERESENFLIPRCLSSL